MTNSVRQRGQIGFSAVGTCAGLVRRGSNFEALLYARHLADLWVNALLGTRLWSRFTAQIRGKKLNVRGSSLLFVFAMEPFLCPALFLLLLFCIRVTNHLRFRCFFLALIIPIGDHLPWYISYLTSVKPRDQLIYTTSIIFPNGTTTIPTCERSVVSAWISVIYRLALKTPDFLLI